MAARKMTFTLPETLALKFTRRVPARERSQYVAAALRERLADRERRLIRACQVANADGDLQAIERDLDALPDTVDEPWRSDE